MIGSTISHYKVVSKLGEGGMGIVYQAEDTRLGRTVALKFISPQLTKDEAAKKRFVNEARTVSKFDHPNICTVHEIDETEDGQTFIAMTFYPGETLDSRIRSAPLALIEAVSIAEQIASGLLRAHESQTIHRDIKPSNVLITSRGAVKLLDFGLAKLSGRKGDTSAGSTPGTLDYMSPEQLMGDDIDHRTDVWSLGVVLYQMVTGRLPFDQEQDSAVMYSIVNRQPPTAKQINPEIPEELDRIIMMCLRKDRSERYESVGLLLSDLKYIRTVISRSDSGPIENQPIHALSRTFWIQKKISWYILGLAIFLIAGFFYWNPFGSMSKSGLKEFRLNRIAVLPFENISPDQEENYFADGITEEVISRLSRLSGLTVISRTSVMRYRSTSLSIEKIGEELKIGSLLEGTVRKAGDKLRITVRLTNVESQATVWSDDYDHDFKEIFTIQSNIATSVARALQVHLKEGEKIRMESPSTDNLDAYSFYLKGLYNWNKRTPAAMTKGLEYFHQAVAMDSSFAPAYSGLADGYALLGSFNYGALPPLTAFPKAKDAARKAKEFAPDLAETITSAANISFIFDRDWKKAEKEFRTATDLNPNYATARHWFSLYFMCMGRFDEALEEINAGLEVDPVSLVINTDVGWILYNARRYDLAIAKLREAIELDPNFIQAHLALGLAYLQVQEYGKAIAIFENAMVLSGGRPIVQASLGYALAISGQKEKAEKILAGLMERAKTEYVPPLYFAYVNVGLDDREEGFKWLNTALDEKSTYFVNYMVDPKLDRFRTDPRYDELAKRIGFERK